MSTTVITLLDALFEFAYFEDACLVHSSNGRIMHISLNSLS